MTRGARTASLPMRVILWPGRMALKGLALPLRPLSARIDSSEGVGRLLVSVSNGLAAQRGLLLLIGTVLIALSLLAHAVVIGALVLSDAVASALAWLCLPLALLHLGLLIGLTGVLLAVPLGPGYPARRE